MHHLPASLVLLIALTYGTTTSAGALGPYLKSLDPDANFSDESAETDSVSSDDSSGEEPLLTDTGDPSEVPPWKETPPQEEPCYLWDACQVPPDEQPPVTDSDLPSPASEEPPPEQLPPPEIAWSFCPAGETTYKSSPIMCVPDPTGIVGISNLADISFKKAACSPGGPEGRVVYSCTPSPAETLQVTCSYHQMRNGVFINEGPLVERLDEYASAECDERSHGRIVNDSGRCPQEEIQRDSARSLKPEDRQSFTYVWGFNCPTEWADIERNCQRGLDERIRTGADLDTYCDEIETPSTAMGESYMMGCCRPD